MTPNQAGHNITLLYVEDDPATRMQVTRLLELSGYHCIVAENGREGLELYRQHTPDIVLTDILMPVMNGLEMARSIRAEFPETQFIIMTAFGETKYLLEAIDIGVSQFVSKPVEFQKLLTAVARCVHTIKLKGEAQHARHLEAISILAGGMAHDFNNLLQVILGYISLAKISTETGSKTSEYLAMAEKGSAQARELGQRLLTLANGSGNLKHSKNLMDLITSAINSSLSGTGIEHEIEMSPDIPALLFNETQMLQVISHLIENAKDAMPYGGTLNVSAHGQIINGDDGIMLPPGDYLHITFADSGKGIPGEALTRIFDPYFSSKDMGNRKGQGLGLTVCYSVIRRHGGTITAESLPGEGTTIHIWLPAAQGNNKEDLIHT
jgi:signal transduction histidine kinase